MIALIFLGNSSVWETLSQKAFIVHEGLLRGRETEPGNPAGSFWWGDCDDPRTLPKPRLWRWDSQRFCRSGMPRYRGETYAMYDRLHTAGGSQTHTRVALVSGEAAWPGRRSGTSV